MGLSMSRADVLPRESIGQTQSSEMGHPKVRGWSNSVGPSYSYWVTDVVKCIPGRLRKTDRWSFEEWETVESALGAVDWPRNGRRLSADGRWAGVLYMDDELRSTVRLQSAHARIWVDNWSWVDGRRGCL